MLLLTHWSLSRGAQKVGSKAQVLGKKTGEKIEAAATRLREKKAALDAARSAARLEVLYDKPTEFIYKKNEENVAESPDEKPPAEDMAVPAQMPDAEEPPISVEEPIEEPAPEADKEAQEEPWTPEEPVKDMEEPPIPPLSEAED